MDNTNAVNNLQILDAVNQASSSCAAEQCNDTTAILQEQAGTNLASMANSERLAYHIDDSVYRTQFATREAVERNADHVTDAVERTGTATALAIERNGGAASTAIMQSENNVTNLIYQTTDEVKTLQNASALETRNLLSDNRDATVTNSKDIVINDNKNATDIELQASSNTFSTKKDLSHVESTLELQAVQNTAQVQYEAVKLNADAAAEMAECCCELKEEVAKSNYETQKIARDIEMQRLRDQLAAATTESIISKIQSSKHHKYRPCPPPPPPCPCPCPPPLQ
jgi:hypothetical protein